MEESHSGLKNDLGTKSKFKTGTSTEDSSQFDSYAFSQSKKLYKSRTDKKWLGVCGGLSEYFGISSTVIRLLFAITFFAGSGTSLLVYIILGIVFDKEPINSLDELE
jgi:phage shock protein PspC (stress-responsive transcriptional regulator)